MQPGCRQCKGVIANAGEPNGIQLITGMEGESAFDVGGRADLAPEKTDDVDANQGFMAFGVTHYALEHALPPEEERGQEQGGSQKQSHHGIEDVQTGYRVARKH